MFSSRNRQIERQGRSGTPRADHLKTLVGEFVRSKSQEAKREVAANLANFGYDPLNFGDMLTLNVVELFLDCLEEQDTTLREFGLAGLTNVCSDSRFCQVVVDAEGISMIITFLSSTNVENVLNAITTLLWLAESSAATRDRVASRPVLDAMKRYAGATNPRLKNMAVAFLSAVAADALPTQIVASVAPPLGLPALSTADLSAMNDKPLY